MPDLPDKIQWHPAFYAAAELELKENIDDLQMIQEYNLSKEPIRMDLLIIKDAEKSKIKNEIGHILRKYNVIEYKSPVDGLSIDDFYKTIGYACLYKGYGEYVNQIPIEELTVSLFRAAYPRELFAELERIGHGMKEQYPGIYYVSGFDFPLQIVVTSRLDKELHSSLRILTDHADITDVRKFLQEAGSRTSPGDRENIDAVLQVSMTANQELYQTVREDEIMCQAMEELMKDIIDQRVEERVAESVDATTVDYLKDIMAKLKYTAEQAMDLINIPQENRSALLKRL